MDQVISVELRLVDNMKLVIDSTTSISLKTLLVCTTQWIHRLIKANILRKNGSIMLEMKFK